MDASLPTKTMENSRRQSSSTFHRIIAWCILILSISTYRTLFSLTNNKGGGKDRRSKNKRYKAEFFPQQVQTSSVSTAHKEQTDIAQKQVKPKPKAQPPKPIPPSQKQHLLQSPHTRPLDLTTSQCGIIFFYHIACTGGSSINRWLGKEKDYNENVTYWTKWGRHDGVEEKFIAGMDQQVEELTTHEWRIVHAHGYSFFPNTSEPYLYKWRKDVEGMGCRFFVTTMLRDAIGHTISQSKGTINPNLTMTEWLTHLNPVNATDRGSWNTQIDYLLYNRGPRNEYNATKEQKVARAVEILRRHFDLVGYSNYDYFMEVILNVTGWERIPMKAANIFNDELRYTERDLELVKRLTEGNGDVMFIDAVRHLYYGHLNYLV